MNNDEEQLLRGAWIDFCEELKRAVDVPFGPTVPPFIADRSAGIEALARNISLLRKVLEADAEKYIETIPKRGYRFAQTVRRRPAENKPPAAVETIDEAAPEPVPETPEVKTHRPVLWLTLVFVAIAGIFSSLSFWNGNRFDRPAVNRSP